MSRKIVPLECKSCCKVRRCSASQRRKPAPCTQPITSYQRAAHCERPTSAQQFLGAEAFHPQSPLVSLALQGARRCGRRARAQRVSAVGARAQSVVRRLRFWQRRFRRRQTRARCGPIRHTHCRRGGIMVIAPGLHVLGSEGVSSESRRSHNVCGNQNANVRQNTSTSKTNTEHNDSPASRTTDS